MASRQRSANSTLLAAAAGIGVALVAGAITLAMSQAQPQRAVQEAPATKRGGSASAHAKRQLSGVSSARARMAKRRRGAWLEASAGQGLSLKTLHATYFELRKRVAASTSDQRFQRVLGDIDRDVPRTASVHAYAETPLFQQQLRHILACVALDDPEVGYVQGLNYIAAFVLVVMRDARGGDDASSEPDAEEADVFAIMVRLLRHPRYHMRSLFTAQLPGLHRMNHVLSSLVAQHTPGVQRVMRSVGSSTMDIHEWWFTLGTYILPWEQLEPLWDLFLVEGWAPMLRTVLGLLQHVLPYMNQEDADMYSVMASLKAFAAHLNDTRQEAVNTDYSTSANGAFMLKPPPSVVSDSNERFSAVTPEIVERLWNEGAPPTPPSRVSSAPRESSVNSSTQPPLPASIMSTSASSEAPPAPPQGQHAGPSEETPADAVPPPVASTGAMGSSALGESWLVVDQPAGEEDGAPPEETQV